MDESVLRNLDTQHRRLAELEQEAQRLLNGNLDDAPSRDRTSVGPLPRNYAELTAANDQLRAVRGWEVVDLDAALTPALRADFDSWQSRQRVRWTFEDVVAVAVAGLVGVAATWFDSTIDTAVRSRLAGLRETELIRGWERDAKRMPIDYMGPKFGGAAHRVRSPGHDIGRPFEALRQIRRGEFRGFYWEDHQRFPRVDGSYEPVEDLGEALTLWGKHLVADVITPMSLPLPGWTKLYERRSSELRAFAHQTYSGGANLRSAALGALPVVTTEVVVRTHVHGRAMLDRGTALLTPAETALRTELLLAGHTLVGAASLGKTLALALAAPVPAAAFRHINWPVLLRAALLSAQVATDARRRRAGRADSWEELLAGTSAPWMLDSCVELDEALGADEAI